MPDQTRYFRFTILGLIYGALAWIAYGLVEYIFLGPAWLAGVNDGVITGWHWKYSGVLMGGYAAIGGLTGALIGLVTALLLHRSSTAEAHSLLPPLAVLTLVVASLANILAQPSLGPADVLYLTVAFGLLLMLLRNTFWDRRKRRQSPGPWIASLLLLGPIWIVEQALDHQPRLVKLAGFGGSLGDPPRRSCVPRFQKSGTRTFS